MPFRTGGSLCASKIPDAQAAYESANTLLPTMHAGTNFVLHAAGWMEGGLSASYEKFVMDFDQLGAMHVLAKGIDMSENGQAMEAFHQVEPGGHFLGCAHTQANFETAFYRSSVADNNSVEQWEAEGRQDAAHARQQDLEEDAGRVRGARDRSRHRRGAARLHRDEEGLDARRDVLRRAGQARAAAPPSGRSS